MQNPAGMHCRATTKMAETKHALMKGQYILRGTIIAEL